MVTIRSQLGRFVVLAGLAMAGLSAQAADYFFDNFDTNTAGQPPPGWLVYVQTTAGSTIDVTSAQSTSPPNSLRLLTEGMWTNGGDIAELRGLGPFNANFLPYFSNDVVSFDIRFDHNSDQQLRFDLVNSGGGSIQQVKFNSGSVIAQYGPSYLQSTNVGTYVADTWYHVAVFTRPVEYTYGIQFMSNGVVLGQAFGLADSNPDTPDGFLFANDGDLTGNSPQSVFVDNIFVGPIPEPSPSMLVTLGALGLFAKRQAMRRKA